MSQLKCAVCGSSEFIMQNGVCICQVCECKYSVEDVKKMMESVAELQGSATTNTDSSVAVLLERAFMFLEDGEWDRAVEYCEKVLDIDYKNARAYLGKLMAEFQVAKQENLKDCLMFFENSNNYKKALQLADDALAAELEGYATACREEIARKAEEARVEAARKAEKARIEEEKKAEKARIEAARRAERANLKKKKIRNVLIVLVPLMAIGIVLCCVGYHKTYAWGKYGQYINVCNLTEFKIPDNVQKIGDNAFEGCKNLMSITIPDSVTSIGERAFSGCTSLTSITIPDSVTSIGDSAFSGCTSLTSITIPDSVTSIGEWAFSGCTSLTSITIPDSVTEIGDGTFTYCQCLWSITIPDSVTSIGFLAFSYSGVHKYHYSGTISQWQNISKDYEWNRKARTYKVYCTDGVCYD